MKKRTFEDAEVQKAYDESFKDKQLVIARRQAAEDAEKEANKKPLGKKLLHGFAGIGKGIANAANSYELPEVDPFTGVRLREPTEKKGKRER